MTSREPVQIRVILIEARALKGKEGESDLVNPAVRVNLDAGPIKKSQRTNIYKDVSSVYFNETKIFEEDIGRDEFDEGRIQIQVEDDQGLFAPRLIGEHSFDLLQVHAASAHEIYNQWVVLLHPDKGGDIQGFLRVAIIALKKGETPKTHTKDELEDDGSTAGPGASMIVGLPDVTLEPCQLILRAYRAQIGSYRQACPDAQVRVLFSGTKPLKSGVVKQNYNPQFNDELLIPIFIPTFADRIIMQLINKGDDDKVIAETSLSLLKIRSEEMEPTWLNMYGPRPAPPSLQQEVANAKDFAEETLVKLSAGAIPERLRSPEVDSAWRARILIYASVESTGPRNPKHQRMPMILSASQLDDIEPETEEFVLRCDLYEAVGWSLPPASALYLVLAWGPTERKSKSNTPANGKIIFESPLVSKTGYYELLDQIEAEMVPVPEQQYDVFLHIYLATPVYADCG